MKFYALLCTLVAAALVLTPAIAMIGTEHEKTAAASDAEKQQTTQAATEWVTENVSAADE